MNGEHTSRERRDRKLRIVVDGNIPLSTRFRIWLACRLYNIEQSGFGLPMKIWAWVDYTLETEVFND